MVCVCDEEIVEARNDILKAFETKWLQSVDFALLEPFSNPGRTLLEPSQNRQK